EVETPEDLRKLDFAGLDGAGSGRERDVLEAVGGAQVVGLRTEDAAPGRRFRGRRGRRLAGIRAVEQRSLLGCGQSTGRVGGPAGPPRTTARDPGPAGAAGSGGSTRRRPARLSVAGPPRVAPSAAHRARWTAGAWRRDGPGLRRCSSTRARPAPANRNARPGRGRRAPPARPRQARSLLRSREARPA